MHIVDFLFVGFAGHCVKTFLGVQEDTSVIPSGTYDQIALEVLHHLSERDVRNNVPVHYRLLYSWGQNAVYAFPDYNILRNLLQLSHGLALGKGVIIAQNEQEAVDAVHSIMEDKIFGESGSQLVVEEFLTGPEVSVLSFTDGKTVCPMISSMDHKRALDGDNGKNTGGMGTVSPNPYYTADIAKQCMDEIFIPTMNAMNAENRSFRGCLYFGLMLTPKGPKVIEYNCRFGDPETQVVLPMLENDLMDIMEATEQQTLSDLPMTWKSGACACVILASGGYPEKYETGKEISGLNDKGQLSSAAVYHAGTKLSEDGKLLTAGGRVLGVTCSADDLQSALDKAYAAVKEISFDKMHYRTDIGKRALAAKQ